MAAVAGVHRVAARGGRQVVLTGATQEGGPSGERIGLLEPRQGPGLSAARRQAHGQRASIAIVVERFRTTTRSRGTQLWWPASTQAAMRALVRRWSISQRPEVTSRTITMAAAAFAACGGGPPRPRSAGADRRSASGLRGRRGVRCLNWRILAPPPGGRSAACRGLLIQPHAICLSLCQASHDRPPHSAHLLRRRPIGSGLGHSLRVPRRAQLSQSESRSR